MTADADRTQVQATSPGVELVTAVHGDFYVQKDDLVARQMKEFGAHTRPAIAFVCSCLAPGDIVLDIGAHIGTFAVPMAKAVAPNGVVWCFEPNAASARLLERNLQANGVATSAKVVQLGISDQGGSLSIIDPDSTNSGAVYLAPETTTLDRIHLVETTTLDAWADRHPDLGHIAFLKIDVEGMEESVLRGAARTITRWQPKIFIEQSASQSERSGNRATGCVELLAEHGYRFYSLAGRRNADSDDFEVSSISTTDALDIVQSVPLVDLIALP